MRRTEGEGPNPTGLCMCGCGQPAPIARFSRRALGEVGGKPRRFIRGHANRAPVPYVEDPATGCWIWQLWRDRKGYGKVSHHGATQLAHRVAYERARGPIPAGAVLLHRCDNPACVNPDHLLVGTVADNNADRDAKDQLRRRLTTELAALREMSEGVAGLTIGGEVMPWPQVLELYLPSLAALERGGKT